MTRAEVASILARFDAAWPGRELTEQTIEIWMEQLAAIPFERARSAANALIAESQFYPSVAAFRIRCKDFGRRDTAEVPQQPALGDTAPNPGNLKRIRHMRICLLDPMYRENHPKEGEDDWVDCDRCHT